MTTSVRVNFGRPFALFPLPETVLLPHTVQMLHVSEPRYRAMVDRVLDSTGQFALATWDRASSSSIAIRDAVCLVQVMHHEKVDGGYEIMLHGICRARIVDLESEQPDRAWCEARLQPLEQLGEDLPPMQGLRDELYGLLTNGNIGSLNRVDSIVDWFQRDDVSTHTLLELIGFTFIQDSECRYRLLAEPTIDGRTRIIRSELSQLERMIGLARRQQRDDLDRGIMPN